MTDQQGPAWLKNLYFVYLLELKALTKVGPQLKNYPFYTGDDLDDKVSLLWYIFVALFMLCCNTMWLGPTLLVRPIRDTLQSGII